MSSDGLAKPKNRKEQITVRQDRKRTIKYDAKGGAIKIPLLDKYTVIRLTNVIWINIDDILTKEHLSRYIAEDVEVIIE